MKSTKLDEGEIYSNILKYSRKYRLIRGKIISANNFIQKRVLHREHADFEPVKDLGGFILKHMPHAFTDFPVPHNIGVDVDFYGKKIHYDTPVSLASYEPDIKKVLRLADIGANPTIKTAMLDYREGNKPPRLYELKEVSDEVSPLTGCCGVSDDGTINTMGLPGPGARRVRYDLEKSRFWEKYPEKRMTISVGGSSKEEYLKVFHIMHDGAPYHENVDFEINVSCPNTPEGQLLCGDDLGNNEKLGELLSEIRNVDDSTPVYVKLSPDFSDEKILKMTKICREHRAGIVLANTQAAKCDALTVGKGGISGPAVNERMIYLVDLVHKTYSDIPIKACGGISNAYDVIRALRGGASTIQMAYAAGRDPYDAIAKTNRDLSRFYRENEVKSTEDLRVFSASKLESLKAC